jgi:hypothetical protein
VITSDVELRRLAAVHEAGHVLLAVAGGCEVDRVAIGPRGGGVTRIRVPRDPRAAVANHLAGAAAEAVALGLGTLPFAEVAWRCTGARTDFERARAATGINLPPGAMAGLLQFPWEGTVRVVVRRWAAVEALARALQRTGAIEGERAVEIVRSRWKR